MMWQWWKRIGVVAVVMLVTLAIVGTVAAQGRGGRRGGGMPFGQGKGDWEAYGRGLGMQLSGEILGAVEEATGLSLREIMVELRGGTSLEALLAEYDVEVQTVIDAAAAEVNAQIDAAVASGRLTEAQAETLRSQAPAAIESALSGTTPAWGGTVRDQVRLQAEESLAAIIAELSGVDAATWLEQLSQLPTLGELAESLGVDVDEAVATAETRITGEINNRVASGDLTQAQADALLEGLHEHLLGRLDTSFFGHMRGWAEGWEGFGPGMMEEWGRGMMEHHGRGMMEHFGAGMMEQYGRGMMEQYGRGMMEHFGSGMHPFGNWWGEAAPEADASTLDS